MSGLRLSTGASILPVGDKRFHRYGRVLDGFDFSQSGEYLVRHTAIPEGKNVYEPSVPGLETLPEFAEVELAVFGGLTAQAGYCSGHSRRLDALEWHQSPEVDYAATPLALLLAAQEDLGADTTIDASRAEAFYLPQGTAVELLPGTLHFAPCAVSPAGFCCLVVLPKGTNTLLPGVRPPFKAVNKWMICHPDRDDLVKAGTLAGISGENTEVIF